MILFEFLDPLFLACCCNCYFPSCLRENVSCVGLCVFTTSGDGEGMESVLEEAGLNSLTC